jgi:hypothetical protein
VANLEGSIEEQEEVLGRVALFEHSIPGGALDDVAARDALPGLRRAEAGKGMELLLLEAFEGALHMRPVLTGGHHRSGADGVASVQSSLDRGRQARTAISVQVAYRRGQAVRVPARNISGMK